jgi:alanine dehydrogenase
LKPNGTILLTRSNVAALLPFKDYLEVVEQAFRLYEEGKVLKPGLIQVNSVDGEFHIKAGGLELSRRFFTLKVNGGFFHHAERFAMPAIQGAILVCDGENGYPLAIMHSIEITLKRTGTAAAVYERAARVGKGQTFDARIEVRGVDSDSTGDDTGVRRSP